MEAWVLYSMLFLIVIIIAAAALIWILGVKSQSPPINRTIHALPSMPYDDITFKSGGLSIKGWFIPAKKAASNPTLLSPLVIIVHGWGSNRTRVLRFVEPLFGEGYSLLLFDARGHGESDPYPTPSGIMFRDDVVAAIDYAQTRSDIDPLRIAIFATSLGAYGSTLAMGQDQRIKAIVTDSMPVRMETMITSELRRHKLPIFPLAYFIPRIWYLRVGITAKAAKELDIVRIINRTKTPMLMIHSKLDDYISSADLDYVLANVPANRIDHLFVHSAGHRSSETDPAFFAAALPFLRKQL